MARVNPQRVSLAAIKQLKSDVKNLPDYRREYWWLETLKLLRDQGYTITAATRKSFETIVYS